MSFVLRKTASFFALIAAFQIMGGHWIVLQSYAWVKMAVEYSETVGFSKGLEKTFDGEHPCEMCRHVQKESQKEKEDPANVDLIKLLQHAEILPVSFESLVFVSISFRDCYPSTLFSFFTRTDAPLTPPPLV